MLDCWAIRFPLGAPPFDPATSIRSLSYTLSAVSRSRAETQNRHPRLRASLFYLYASHNSDRLSEYTPPQGYFFFSFPFFWSSSFEQQISAWSFRVCLFPFVSTPPTRPVLRKPQIISHPSTYHLQPSCPTIPGSWLSLFEPGF